jgi:hypothetical protein
LDRGPFSLIASPTRRSGRAAPRFSQSRGNPNEAFMRRTAILIGAGLFFAAPVADAGMRYFSSRAALAAFDRMKFEHDQFSVGTISFDPWSGALKIDALVVHTPTFSIRIGRVTSTQKSKGPLLGTLVSMAVAQEKDVKPHSFSSAIKDAAEEAADAGKISAEDIVIERDEATYKIPRIDVSGTDLDEDDLAALFDAANKTPVAERFAKVSADRVTIPEVSVQLKNSPTTGTLVYHDIELNNIVKSRAADGTIKSVNANLITQDGATLDASCGLVQSKDYDIAQNARIMSGAASPLEAQNAPEPPMPLYGKLTVENCRIASDNKNDSAKVQTVIEISSISASDVKGRPPMQSFAAAKDLFDVNRPNPDDPDILAKRGAYLADIYAAYEAGSVEMADLRITGTAPEGAAFSGSLAKISLSHFTASKIDEIRFDDMSVDAGGTKVKLADFVLRGINFANITKLVQNKTEEHPAPLPILDQILVDKLDVDAVDSKTDPNAHAHFQIAKFDMTGQNSIGGVPTHFAMGLDHFTMDLSTLKTAEAASIVALGYGKLDLSSRLAINFDAAKQELAVEDFSFLGKDMGAIKLSGQFSNVSPDLFSRDQSVAEAAIFSALVNRLEIKIENVGLFEKLIAAEAKKEGKTSDDIKRSYVAAASVNVPVMLDNGPKAKLIGAALAKFVASPKNFHLIAHAANGLGASDFALIKEPGTLIEKLEIDVTANE